MANCNARTDSRGRRVWGNVAVDELVARPLSTVVKRLPDASHVDFEKVKLGDLLTPGRAIQLDRIVQYLINNDKVLASKDVWVGKYQGRYYVKTGRKVYTCRGTDIHTLKSSRV